MILSLRILALLFLYPILAFTPGYNANAQEDPEDPFQDRSIIVGDAEVSYKLIVPDDYSDDESWPVILFLHGAGEKGTDGVAQTEVGLGPAVLNNAAEFPAIVVFPQTPHIWDDDGLMIARASLEDVIAEFNVDSDRVYLTGLSMGGNGAWRYAYNEPDTFAAVVVVCGWIRGYRPDFYPIVGPDDDKSGYTDVAETLQNLPIWIFHGDDDPVVPVRESRRMNLALINAGADVRYSEFSGVGHNAWDPAYAYSAMIEWLFEQSR